MLRTPAFLLALAVATGCYTALRTGEPDAGTSTAGHGGAGGTAAASGGTNGGARGGLGGTGGGGTDSSGPVFVGGPCVVTPDQTTVEVFGRASDGHIYRRSFDGRNWAGWIQLVGLDGTMIDARSDLDCSASIDTIHIVATGLNPPGALLHAFGFGTTYNPFTRELSPTLSTQSPSILSLNNSTNYVAWAGQGQQPALYEFPSGAAPKELTPITTLVSDLVSGVDLSWQAPSVLFAALDSSGALAIYPLISSSSGENWSDPLTLYPPSQAVSFNPTMCAESGSSGSFSINVAVVTGHDLWFAATPRISTGPIKFSDWTTIHSDAASAPDCTILRANPNLEAIIHVATLSSRGTIVDVEGNGANWTTTELGFPP
jgi:hypothetical protein